MMGFSRKGIFSIVIVLLFTLLVGCTGGGSSTYTASGKVIDDKGKALAGVKLIVTGGTSIPDATVKADGTFILSKLTKTCIITPHLEGYVFTPKSATIKAATTKLQFIGAPIDEEEPAEIDKSELEDYIDEVKDYKKADYKEGWEAFASALENAQAVLANGDATQEDVDNALSALDAAIENLKKTEEEDPKPITLESIAIKKPADKLVYFVDEELDITGLVIEGTYSDGSKKDVSISTYNVTGFDSSNAEAKQTLTVAVDERTVTYTIEIKEPVIMVSAITVSPTTMELTVGGGTKTITATVLPATATNKNVTWTSSNIAVATVADGVVTPKTVGTTGSS